MVIYVTLGLMCKGDNMLKKEQLEKYLVKCLSTGADFAEIFLEDSSTKVIYFIDKKIQKVNNSFVKGIGVRVCLKDRVFYGSTNNFDEIDTLIERLISNFSNGVVIGDVKLSNKKVYKDKIEISHDDFSIDDKKKFLYKVDRLAREEDTRVNQVELKLIENNQKVVIANSNGNYVEDNRVLSRFAMSIFAKENEKVERVSFIPGFKLGYEYLKKIDIESVIKEKVNAVIKKLGAILCPSGEMPVIIGNGFGGVIFHEACVHSLEATTVAKGSSNFSGMLGKKIASDKVTIVDDGSIKNEWGSFNIDDEGFVSKKNVLIENGVLTSYLIDYINGKTMHSNNTSSGRRESYKYAPTSRMSNTFLLEGEDKFEDMIASIDYGVYAKKMGGGSVDSKTGDFNFAVDEAYLIEKGKITKALSGASLIGNGSEIIKNVSMVSDDLKLAAGMCGSLSGYVPTTVGQPTIKVDRILVGGKGEKVNV